MNKFSGIMRSVVLVVLLLACITSSTANEHDGSDDVGDGLVTIVNEEISTQNTASASDDVGGGQVTIVKQEIAAHKIGSNSNEEKKPNSDGVGHVMLDTINKSYAQDQESHYTILSSTFTMGLKSTTSKMDSARAAMFVSAVEDFLDKIFNSQEKYDITVKGVTVVKQSMLSTEEDRSLEGIRGEDLKADILELEMVLVAEFKPVGDQILNNVDLRKIILHVCQRFEEHLVKRVKEMDQFFASVQQISAESHSYDIIDSHMVTSDEESEYSMATSAIVGITLGSAAFAFMLLGCILYCRRRKRRDVLPTRKISSKWSTTDSNTSNKNESDRPITIEFHKHLPETAAYPYGPKRVDPYGPQSYGSYNRKELKQILENRKSAKSKQRASKLLKNEAHGWRDRSGKESKTVQPLTDIEDVLPAIEEVHSRSLESVGSETIEFESNLSQSFEECNNTRLSSGNSLLHTELMKKALRKDCVAPAGKLGVAIDTINNQPVVHRIKPGSPLDGVLERFDRIVAIDDIDTSAMSAADVTQLMVKKMNQERKISYIRGGDFRSV